MGRYSNIGIIKNSNENVGNIGNLYYKPNFYPTIQENESDIWVITNFGDRLDLLANQFYNDFSLYWIIACANPDKINFGSLYIIEGTQIRIPTRLGEIIDNYNKLNSL